MKKIAILLSLFFIAFSNVNAEKINFKVLHNLTFGMNEQQALSLIKKKKLHIEQIGQKGKNISRYYYELGTSLFGYKIFGAMFIIYNGKIMGFYLDLNKISCSDFAKALDKKCNYKKINTYNDEIYYYFDNCTISMNLKKEECAIVDPKFDINKVKELFNN